MTWRDAGRTLRGGGMALALGAIATLAQPASAQQYERKLAGIRLNSAASVILRTFGNPNEVVIGDVGIRQAPPQAGNQAGAGGGFGGGGGGLAGFGGGPSAGGPSIGGRGGGLSNSSGAPAGYGGPGGYGGGRGGGGFGGGGGSFGGPPSSSGPPPGYGGSGGYGGGRGGGLAAGGQGDEGGLGGSPGGFGGGFGGRGGSGTGGGVGQFGQTTSTLARQQEVTWIYNRKVNNNLVSYEFLIAPNGNVSQIRVSGYGGGNSRTARRIALGNTYKDVVRAYGFPEEHYQVGRILVASYKKKAHAQFQFLNERGTANQNLMGNKIVAITIASVE